MYATMAEKPQKMADKLKVLWSGLTQHEVATRIGVSVSQVKAYRSGATPGGAVLLAISDQFEVPIRWLLDDALPAEPVPATAADFAGASVRDLLEEVAARIRGDLDNLGALLDHAERIDCEAFAARLKDESPYEALPPDLEQQVQVVEAIQNMLLALDRLRPKLDFAKAIEELRGRRDELFKRIFSTGAVEQFMMARVAGKVFSLEREDQAAEVQRLTEALQAKS